MVAYLFVQQDWGESLEMTQNACTTGGLWTDHRTLQLQQQKKRREKKMKAV